MAARAGPSGAVSPTSPASTHPCTLHVLNTPSYFQFPGFIPLLLASGLSTCCALCRFMPLFPSQANSTNPSGLHLESLLPGSLPGHTDRLHPQPPALGWSAPVPSLPMALLGAQGWVPRTLVSHAQRQHLASGRKSANAY